jgi:hypothetical protein
VLDQIGRIEDSGPAPAIAKYVVRSRMRDGGQGTTRERVKGDREQELTRWISA